MISACWCWTRLARRSHVNRHSVLSGAVVLGLLVGMTSAGAAEGQGAAQPAFTAGHPPVGSADSAGHTDGVGGFRLPPLETYAEVLRRPLFSRDRRPHDVPPAAAASPPSFTLRGIVVDAGVSYAIVEEGSAIKRVTEGQALGGGTVIRISPDRVVLTIDGADKAVKLFDPAANDRPNPKSLPSSNPAPGFVPGLATGLTWNGNQTARPNQ